MPRAIPFGTASLLAHALNADSTLRQLRRECFRPAESLPGSLRGPIGIDAAGKSTKHDDAVNLVTLLVVLSSIGLAHDIPPLRQLRVPDMTAFGSTVEFRLKASGN